MNYFQKKKLAFMSIVNRVKGFVRTVTGVLPLTLANCVDEDSIIDYTLYGQSVQNGTPTPDNPIEVECVGDLITNLFDKNNPNLFEAYINTTKNQIGYPSSNSVLFLIPCKANTTYTIGYDYSSVSNSIFRTACIEVDNITTQTWTNIYNYDYTTNADHIIKTTANSKFIAVQIGYFAYSEAMKTLRVVEGDSLEVCGKYKIPIKVSGKNLLSPQKWVSGEHSNGIIVYPNVDYITSMGENYIEANLAAWQGVASEKFEYAKVNTVGFKINKNQVVDDYTIYYIGLQGYDVDGKKTIFKQLSTSVVADKKYVFKKNNGNFEFGLSATSVRLCILSRSQAITGLRVYDFYSTNDAETGYEPYHEPITTNIYLDEPLGEGQSINYKRDGLPTIPTFKGTSIISADTTIQPSNAEITYYSNVKE